MSKTGLTEEDVITGIKNDDQSTLSELYRAHYPLILNFIVNNKGDEQDAKDIYQEAFMVLIHNIKNEVFKAESKVRTYLYSICRRQWLKELHNRNRYMIGYQDHEDYVEIDIQEGDEIDEFRERYVRMENCLREIGEPCRSVIKMFYIQKRSMQDIAEEMGYTNASNAKTQKYKCLKRLKKVFFSNNTDEGKDE